MDELLLYESILQLRKPWSVDKVSLDGESETVNVYVTVNTGSKISCPHCGKAAPRYDSRPRTWRHLDTCQYQTLVHADVPRVNCSEHGVVTMDVTWAESGSRFTQLFEARVVDWLKESSINAVARRFKLSWSAVDRVMQRAVARGLQRRSQLRLTDIGVDETSFKKGRHYVTVVTDQSGCVIDVQDGHRKDSLKSFYDTLSDEQKQALRSVSMDMSPAYIACTLEQIPDARKKIAFDHYHVSAYMTKAVDKVRQQEQRHLSREVNQRLKGTRYLWLANPHNLSRSQNRLVTNLSKIANKTGRAWAIKEYCETLWSYKTVGWAVKAWKQWYSWASRCRLKPIQTAARMIRSNLWGIINAIVLNANNAMAESVNSKIKILKIKARGYRNRQRFKTAILFHYGGLDLSFDPL